MILIHLNAVFTLEPFLEALPQVVILLTLSILDWDIVIDGSEDLFFLTFFSSIFTASFGITKFLKIGPCRLIPEEGLGGGYFQIGFIVTFFNVTAMILSKAFMFVAMADLADLASLTEDKYKVEIFWDGNHYNDLKMIITWITVCFLPNLILVSVILSIQSISN